MKATAKLTDDEVQNLARLGAELTLVELRRRQLVIERAFPGSGPRARKRMLSMNLERAREVKAQRNGGGRRKKA